MRHVLSLIALPRTSEFGGGTRYAHLIVATVLLCGGTATAAPLTLQEAVREAFAKSPSAEIARLEKERASEDLAANEADYWPNLAVTSQAGWSNRMDEKLQAVDATGRVREYPLSSLGSQEGWFNLFFRQLVFDLSKWRLIEQSEIEAQAVRIGEAQQREEIALDVMTRYAHVVRLQHLLEIEQSEIASTEWLDRQAQLLLDAGRCLPSQREQVGVHLETLRLEGTLRQEEIPAARAALIAAIGNTDLSPDALALDSTSLFAATGVINEEETLAHVDDAPPLRILAARVKADEVRLSAARAGNYPKVGLVAGYSHYGVKRYDSYTDEMRAGIDLQMPIFDGFKNRHLVSAASNDLEIARIRYRSMLDAKRTAVRDLAREFTASERRTALARQQERLSTERVRLADLGLQAQSGDLESALNARQQHLRSATLSIDSEYEHIRLWGLLQHEAGLLAPKLSGERTGSLDEAP